MRTTAHEAGTVRGQRRRKGACTTVPSPAVSVSGGIRAVKVHVLVSEEATVAVLSEKICGSDAVPRVAHPRLDVAFRERAVFENALPPEVKEGVVERREAFGGCGWNAYDLYQLLAAPIVELIHYLGFAVDGGAIQHQQQRILVQGSGRLCEEVADVLQQHVLVHTPPPLLR